MDGCKEFVFVSTVHPHYAYPSNVFWEWTGVHFIWNASSVTTDMLSHWIMYLEQINGEWPIADDFFITGSNWTWSYHNGCGSCVWMCHVVELSLPSTNYAASHKSQTGKNNICLVILPFASRCKYWWGLEMIICLINKTLLHTIVNVF